jgi:hypothetical protein
MYLKRRTTKSKYFLCVVYGMISIGSYFQQKVVNEYKRQSGEQVLHDHDDVKRHWIEKMCNEFNNPTGKAGAANDFVLFHQRS